MMSFINIADYCRLLSVEIRFTDEINSTFCPHSVFVCFVWNSAQTAIILLYSIN
jgi:hypothetical protein